MKKSKQTKVNDKTHIKCNIQISTSTLLYSKLIHSNVNGCSDFPGTESDSDRVRPFVTRQPVHDFAGLWHCKNLIIFDIHDTVTAFIFMKYLFLRVKKYLLHFSLFKLNLFVIKWNFYKMIYSSSFMFCVTFYDQFSTFMVWYRYNCKGCNSDQLLNVCC